MENQSMIHEQFVILADQQYWLKMAISSTLMAHWESIILEYILSFRIQWKGRPQQVQLINIIFVNLII